MARPRGRGARRAEDRALRVAHVTDIHWQVPPTLGDLTIKRAFGTANLYLRGRRHHFDRAVQQALVQHLLALEPDLVCVTGDLTAQALDAEFEAAKSDLQPVLDAIPTFVIPGNHDVYTPGAQRERRIQSWFGPWMGSGAPVPRLDVGRVTCLGLDPNAPSLMLASAVLPQDQLDALAAHLADPELAERSVVLCVHYPLLDGRDRIYDNASHGLRNAAAVIDVLRAGPVRPALILHGHEHHGYTSRIELDEGSIPIYDCGSSGRSFEAGRRAAAMCVYRVEDGTLAGVDRYVHDGRAFVAEPGGPFTT